jgi:hypothetical protein
MSATVLAFAARSRPLSRAEVQDFLANDTYAAYGVAVWWGTGHELLVATADRVLAVLAADAVVRRQLGGPLPEVFAGVTVDEPMSVELLADACADGTKDGTPTWQRASRPDGHTVRVCRVWPGEDGAS